MSGRMPEPCAYMVRAGNMEEPPEYCDEDAVEGSEFCEGHQEPDYEYDPDPSDLSWSNEHSPTL